jgi:hypothetical protein
MSSTKMHTSILVAELMHGDRQTNRHDDVRRPPRLYERARQAFSIQGSCYAQTPLHSAVGLNDRFAVRCLHPWWCSVFNATALYIQWVFDSHQLVSCCTKQQSVSWPRLNRTAIFVRSNAARYMRVTKRSVMFTNEP